MRANAEFDSSQAIGDAPLKYQPIQRVLVFQQSVGSTQGDQAAHPILYTLAILVDRQGEVVPLPNSAVPVATSLHVCTSRSADRGLDQALR